MGHRNKGAHLTGQQADVYSVVLGRRSNQHQDSPWQCGSAPTLESPISKSADGLECCNLHCTKNILVKTRVNKFHLLHNFLKKGTKKQFRVVFNCWRNIQAAGSFIGSETANLKHSYPWPIAYNIFNYWINKLETVSRQRLIHVQSTHTEKTLTIQYLQGFLLCWMWDTDHLFFVWLLWPNLLL